MKKLLERTIQLRDSLNRLYLNANDEQSVHTKNVLIGKIWALTTIETYILEDMHTSMDRDIHNCTATEIIDD